MVLKRLSTAIVLASTTFNARSLKEQLQPDFLHLLGGYEHQVQTGTAKRLVPSVISHGVAESAEHACSVPWSVNIISLEHHLTKSPAATTQLNRLWKDTVDVGLPGEAEDPFNFSLSCMAARTSALPFISQSDGVT
ncbi:hypothetical protein IFM47457_04965 [Aspergillus lentulus]|nr:hypothetical protein IFM47457_04965 [Aspergillus lentulus]